MTLRPFTDANSMTLILSVQNDGSIAQMIKDLNDALTLVKESLDDRDLYYCTIDVSGKWRPGDAELMPWDDPFRSAWQALVDRPDFRKPLATWLGRVVALIRDNQASQISCISEHDETQFGEVPASLLALTDKRFVPVYAEFLKVWDLGHAVSQFDVVELLIEAHGRNAVTNPLSAIVADWI